MLHYCKHHLRRSKLDSGSLRDLLGRHGEREGDE
jgi:hypothetical protein